MLMTRKQLERQMQNNFAGHARHTKCLNDSITLEVRMPIRGDRLRWPPRPGKKSSATTGTRRASSTDDPNLMRRRDERDEAAEPHRDEPRSVIRQAHNDIRQGQQDTNSGDHALDVVAPKATDRDKAANKR